MDFIQEDLSYKPESFYKMEKRMGTKLVDMNQIGITHSTPGKRGAIGTFALSGCTSLVVIVENPNDLSQRAAAVGHYDPMMLKLNHHEEHLKNVLRKLKLPQYKTQAFIVSPGWGDIKSPTGFAPADVELEGVKNLTRIIKEQLGRDTSVVSLGYQALTSRDSSEQGTVLVEFPEEQTRPTKLYVGGVPIKLA